MPSPTTDEAIRAQFERTFGAAPSFLAHAPGRVNLIGEHTDYNEGFVLPVAIDRSVRIYGRPRVGQHVRLYSLNFDQLAEFDLDDIRPSSHAPWSNYCRGVAWSLREAGHTLVGFDGVVYGDVPVGSGLSSSAAIEMATLAAFQAATPGLEIDPPMAARLAQRAENEFVGVKCGIMDQLIAALGRAGHALLIDCRSLEYQPVPLPSEVTLLVIDTAAPRSLAASAYNERRAQCEQAAQLLGVKALRDLSPAVFESHRSLLTELLAKRATHVVYENARVLEAVEAMRL
ncbi:MAG: galactokinase, partial [Thermoflexales bacterium]|nr:galactokinase [Thermoflexales bacterium]